MPPEKRSPRDKTPTDRHGSQTDTIRVARAVARLPRLDRNRLLNRLAEQRAADRLMRERGTLPGVTP